MQRSKNIFWLLTIVAGICAFTISCNRDKKDNLAHLNNEETKETYTCPMHLEIVRDKPGDCPICGMALVKKESNSPQITDVKLETLLKPANEFVVSSIPVTSIQAGTESIEIESLGTTAYDTRMIKTIAAKVSGRIEKLYVRYNFQNVTVGQKVMDIYSPELQTAQQNLLFLLKNDSSNSAFIAAAKEKLLLLGVTEQQLQQVLETGISSFTFSVFSNYEGHIHDSENNMSASAIASDLTTREMNVKEGMYVQKGQAVFSVYNPHHLWAMLNIYSDKQALIKVGNRVSLFPETAPGKDFNAKIDFIEPFFRKDNKTLTVRVFFDNSTRQISVGSPIKAVIYGNAVKANWLPIDAVLSLGIDKVVFQKTEGGFISQKIETGITYNNKIQVLKGLLPTDSVAANAQYLVDSESFIKVSKTNKK